MEKYTIYCTKNQARKALELGAPIEFKTLCHYDLQNGKFIPYPDLDIDIDGEPILILPTVEQMIGWLEEQKSDMRFEVATGIAHTWHYYIHLNYGNHYHNLFNSDFSSRKEATLAAIDAALDYLSKDKK